MRTPDIDALGTMRTRIALVRSEANGNPKARRRTGITRIR